MDGVSLKTTRKDSRGSGVIAVEGSTGSIANALREFTGHETKRCARVGDTSSSQRQQVF